MARTVHAVDANKAAKHLGIGRNKLLELLRTAGITHSDEMRRNLPKKEYRERGLFSSELTEYWQGDVRKLHEKLTITADGMELCRELIENNKHGMAKDRQIHA